MSEPKNFWSAIFLGAVALGAGPASGQPVVNDGPPIVDNKVVTYKCRDHFKDLPAMAERLHVSPIDKSVGGLNIGFMLQMCDGRSYDFMALINAVLDRMDEAAKR